MGNKQGVFTKEKLEELQDCTYFSGRKIKRLYKKFAMIDPQRINHKIADFDTKLTFSAIQSLPEMRENPFKARVCEVFSSSGSGMTFGDFLDMCSVFSEGAPWDLKAAYAFRVYDFNSDAQICRNDLEETLICITDDGLESEELETIIDYVLKEVDITEDGKLSYTEFEHIISRAPDFINLFRISF